MRLLSNKFSTDASRPLAKAFPFLFWCKKQRRKARKPFRSCCGDGKKWLGFGNRSAAEQVGEWESRTEMRTTLLNERRRE
jgi:hypothetical protein